MRQPGGGFFPESGSIALPDGRGASAVATGDFNTDNRPDIVAASWNGARVYVPLRKQGGFAIQQGPAVGANPRRSRSRTSTVTARSTSPSPT